jgi:chromatin remodeling complex protein RSC6
VDLPGWEIVLGGKMGGVDSDAPVKNLCTCVKGLRNKAHLKVKMPAGKKTGGTKAKATKKTASAPAAAAAAPAPEVEAAANASEVADDTWCAATELESLIEEFATLKAGVSAALSGLRDFKKKNDRTIKRLVKSQSKKKTPSGPRKPSGFTKPTKITTELATFLGKPAGTEMARTDVTKEINAYIRQHNLQDSENGRKINPDKKLAQLLQIKKDDVLTYFNLQRFMSPHFIKATASA